MSIILCAAILSVNFVMTAVRLKLLKSSVISATTQCSLLAANQSFTEPCGLHIQGLGLSHVRNQYENR
jgi:hypothetical protein